MKFRTLALIAFCGMVLSGCSSSENELHLYMWGNYVKPDLIAHFERQHDCRVVIDTYDSNEVMYAKLKAGATGYDIIFPSNYIFELMAEQGMLRHLDEAKLSNFHYLDPTYLHLIPDSQRRFGIPYMLTYTGIAYRSDKVHDIPESWGIFADTKYKRRMTMLNDIREVLGAALKYLGYSINTVDPQQLKQATELLLTWKQNIAKFESEQYQHGIASGEFLIVQGYSGDILHVMQDNPSVQFVFPKEGSIITLDLMAIPQNAPNPELALAFINFLLDPEVAAENIGYTYYLCPNTGAYDLLPSSMKQTKALFPPEEIIKRSEVTQNLGSATTLYIQAWDQIKG